MLLALWQPLQSNQIVPSSVTIPQIEPLLAVLTTSRIIFLNSRLDLVLSTPTSYSPPPFRSNNTQTSFAPLGFSTLPPQELPYIQATPVRSMLWLGDALLVTRIGVPRIDYIVPSVCAGSIASYISSNTGLPGNNELETSTLGASKQSRYIWHTLCTLDVKDSGALLAGVWSDRVAFLSSDWNSGEAQLKVKPISALEPLVLGLLGRLVLLGFPELTSENLASEEVKNNQVKPIVDVLEAVVKRYTRLDSGSLLSEGPGCDYGISPLTVQALMDHGYWNLSRFLVQSSPMGRLAAFRDRHIFPPQLIARLAHRNHQFSSAIHDMLVDRPQALQSDSGRLLQPTDPTSFELVCMGDELARLGQIQEAVKCYDVAGRDDKLIALLSLIDSGSSMDLLQELIPTHPTESWTHLTLEKNAPPVAYLAQSSTTTLLYHRLSGNVPHQTEEGRYKPNCPSIWGVASQHAAAIHIDPSKLCRPRPELLSRDKLHTLPNWKINSDDPQVSSQSDSIFTLTQLPMFALDTPQAWWGLPVHPLTESGGVDLSVGQREEDTVAGYWRFDNGPSSSDWPKVRDYSQHGTPAVIYGSVFLFESNAPVDPGDGKRVQIQLAVSFSADQENDQLQSQNNEVDAGEGQGEPGPPCIAIPIEPDSSLDLGFFQRNSKKGNVTYELWVRQKELEEQVLMCMAIGGQEIWRLTVGSTPTFYCNVNPAHPYVLSPPNQLFETNKWYHLVLMLSIKTGSRGKAGKASINLLVDCEVVAQGDVMAPNPSQRPSSEIPNSHWSAEMKCGFPNSLLVLGHGIYSEFPGTKFSGALTEFRVWDTARSVQQIEESKDAYLKIANKRKGFNVEVHPSDCTCEVCEKRKQDIANAKPLMLAPLKDPSSGPSKPGKLRRPTKSTLAEDALQEKKEMSVAAMRRESRMVGSKLGDIVNAQAKGKESKAPKKKKKKARQKDVKSEEHGAKGRSVTDLVQSAVSNFDRCVISQAQREIEEAISALFQANAAPGSKQIIFCANYKLALDLLVKIQKLSPIVIESQEVQGSAAERPQKSQEDEQLETKEDTEESELHDVRVSSDSPLSEVTDDAKNAALLGYFVSRVPLKPPQKLLTALIGVQKNISIHNWQAANGILNDVRNVMENPPVETESLIRELQILKSHADSRQVNENPILSFCPKCQAQVECTTDRCKHCNARFRFCSKLYELVSEFGHNECKTCSSIFSSVVFGMCPICNHGSIESGPSLK